MFISVPATSANLGPGFDTLGLAINLRNEITIKPSRFLSISTRGEGAEKPHIRKKYSIYWKPSLSTYWRLFKGKKRIKLSRNSGGFNQLKIPQISFKEENLWERSGLGLVIKVKPRVP